MHKEAMHDISDSLKDDTQPTHLQDLQDGVYGQVDVFLKVLVKGLSIAWIAVAVGNNVNQQALSGRPRGQLAENQSYTAGGKEE